VVALENGRRGETIRVRNADSGEMRRATVVGPRNVEAADPDAMQ
jgi:flagella basal body P-ring formation protein FlgA